MSFVIGMVVLRRLGKVCLNVLVLLVILGSAVWGMLNRLYKFLFYDVLVSGSRLVWFVLLVLVRCVLLVSLNIS